MHKEDQQATGDPNSLWVTNKERANPQLSSGMSALNLNKPIFSASFIIHSESASGHDVSADFTAEADLDYLLLMILYLHNKRHLTTMREDLLWVERDIPISSCFPLPGPHVALGQNIHAVVPDLTESGVENLIPIPSESEGIPNHVCDVPSHDNSPPIDISKDQIEDFSESNEKVSSIDDDSFSIDDIDYVEASPLDFELVSSEVMEIVIPEVGGIDDDILLTINHDDLQISSGSTTTSPDISLSEYEVFHDDHVKEISSGSPTTHSDSSLYASFMFDLSINPFPPADRSDSYELTDELIPFISAPEYDCFRFKVEPNSRDFTKDVVENISPTKEPQVHNALPTHPTLQLNMKFQPSSEYLFAYVVWIFLPFLNNPPLDVLLFHFYPPFD
nr:hypothetical protein [Tanacetum cinerariifolium]